MSEMKTIIILLHTILSSRCFAEITESINLVESNECMNLLDSPKWDSNMENEMAYPKGDKEKLSQIADVWCRYYKCAARVASTLTPSKRMPSTTLTVYRGATARLPCGLCVAPGELNKLVWMYSKSTDNMSFVPLLEHHHIVHKDSAITIYHVEATHAGVYRCQLGRSVSGLVFLRVIDEEKYIVVKPSTSGGPYPSPPMVIEKDLISFTSWSTWSECSSCGKVGRRRRYGFCYVTRKVSSQKNSTHRTDAEKRNNQITNDVFEDFPTGIPGRSERLPQRITELPAVKQRRSEIMIAMCKVPCTNNTDADMKGISTRPLPGREIQFVVHGEAIRIRCPGSTLRDMPVSWRVGAKAVLPRCLDEGSEGRIHLNARDHLVFTEVLYSDTNLYSCWQGERLAGTVKLIVWGGEHTFWNHRSLLVIMVIVAGAVFRFLDRALYHRQG